MDVYDIATAPRSNSAVWNQGTTTWADLAEMVRNPADYKECGNYLLGRLKGNSRSRETVLSRSMVTLDADSAHKSLLDQVELVLGYSAIVHTTFRSTPAQPRYRILIELDRSVTPAEYRTLAWVLMGRLGREQFDSGSLQPERYMFLPSHDPDHPEWYGSWVFEAAPAPVDELLAGVAALVPSPVEDTVETVATGAELPADYVKSRVALALQDLDALASLDEGERMPWPGEAEGVGWDRGGLYLATRLVEAANSGAGYTLDDARRDWAEHAPPTGGSFDQDHKWASAVKHVGGRSLPYDAPEDDFSPESGGKPPAGEIHSGQIRMAYRLAAQFGGQLLHVYDIGWHYWDEQRWAPDDRGVADRMVKEVLRQGLVESMKGDKRLRSDVSKCESAAGVRGVLAVAASDKVFARTASQMDADPFLFNCANGTLDLRDRRLRPHSPADNITKVARGAYDPAAPGEAWDAFLERVLPDEEERGYLRRVVGQSLYGGVREHLFPVLTGTGANGKGTTYGALVHALGDYATVVSPDLLMVGQGNVGGPEMMTLRGARLVVASEIGKERVLDDALMKRLTGGDQITARYLFKNTVTWTPTHQLLYVTNHKPQTNGDDDAVWRRMRVVPFNVVIPPEDQDLDLAETLLLHADAVLTWAVRGYFDHADNGGMREPAAVVSATAEYQHESDDIARFLEERCEVKRGATVAVSELWQAWMNWRDEEGAELLSKKAFGTALAKRGFRAGMTREGARIRHGVQLLAESDFS